MHRVIIALAALVLAAGSFGCAAPRAAAPATPEQAAVMRAVHQFIDGFNAGDTAKALAVCADSMSIIDEFPPHEWQGAGAGAKWVADYEADAKQNGISDALVRLGVPRHIDVAGDRAYVVAPVDFAYKVKGKSAQEIGSTITLSLQQVAAGWRITGWAWSKN